MELPPGCHPAVIQADQSPPQY